MGVSFRSLRFRRRGVVLRPDGMADAQLGVMNPACARLRDGVLQLYPRMVAEGNVSRIGSYRACEGGETLELEPRGFALEPEAPYELRDEPGGYGCEDPRVTFIPVIDRYVMAYVAFGPRGPEVAVAISQDGLEWERLGLVQFQESSAPVADKDAAFFPEPVRSPKGLESLAFFHRPTLELSLQDGPTAIEFIESLPPKEREGIAIGYVSLDAVRADIRALCTAVETHRLRVQLDGWGTIKVGCGTPPVRIDEGWLSVIHGVDRLAHPSGSTLLRYSAGLIVLDAQHVDRVLYRSPEPLVVPEFGGEVHGSLNHIVFPTGIDRRGEHEFDIYYGMADYQIGCGRLTISG